MESCIVCAMASSSDFLTALTTANFTVQEVGIVLVALPVANSNFFYLRNGKVAMATFLFSWLLFAQSAFL